ncbi:MAG: helix-turn-helix domain-containing protein [Alistipes senegalensis]|nr:helix-turn-helix domain-containing protein [Alistipes senegalensis]
MMGEKLRLARKKAKMSQEEVAEILNISRSNISKYENDKLEPNIYTLKQFCELYNITADYLLGIEIKHNENNTSSRNTHIVKNVGNNSPQANINIVNGDNNNNNK